MRSSKRRKLFEEVHHCVPDGVQLVEQCCQTIVDKIAALLCEISGVILRFRWHSFDFVYDVVGSLINSVVDGVLRSIGLRANLRLPSKFVLLLLL